MDYGISVSQKGKDVKITADRFFTLSSSFQALKVFNTHPVSTTIPTAGNTNVITITHSLGYYAPALIVYNGSTTLGTGTSYLMSDSFSALDIEIGLNTIKINVDEDFDYGFSNTGDTVYFTVYSFLDNFDSFTAPVLSTDTTTGADGSDYGFRISKPGFDVKTCAEVDCIITSKRPSMTIHKKGVDDTGTIAHGLGYAPTYFAWLKATGDDYLSNFGNYVIWINETNLEWDTAPGELYYLIFKNNV